MTEDTRPPARPARIDSPKPIESAVSLASAWNSPQGQDQYSGGIGEFTVDWEIPPAVRAPTEQPAA